MKYISHCLTCHFDRNGTKWSVVEKSPPAATALHPNGTPYRLSLIFFSLQSELHRPFQILQIILVPAHFLSLGIAQFRHSPPVHGLQFDHDVQRFLARVVGAERADAEGNLRPVLMNIY